MAPPLRTDLFINGQYVESSSKERLSIHSPVDDSLVTDNVQIASEQDVDAAVDAAEKAFPAWRDMAGSKRAACMLRFAQLLEENVERLAELGECRPVLPVFYRCMNRDGGDG